MKRKALKQTIIVITNTQEKKKVGYLVKLFFFFLGIVNFIIILLKEFLKNKVEILIIYKLIS